jgi:hypothetical protein
MCPPVNMTYMTIQYNYIKNTQLAFVIKHGIVELVKDGIVELDEGPVKVGAAMVAKRASMNSVLYVLTLRTPSLLSSSNTG